MEIVNSNYIATKYSYFNTNRKQYKINTLKGLPCCKKFENLYHFLPTLLGHQNLSCGRLIVLQSVGNSFKTCNISVFMGKAWHWIATLYPSMCKIYRDHIKAPQDIVGVKKKYVFEMFLFCVFHTTKLQGSPFNVSVIKQLQYHQRKALHVCAQ